mmetsp:Transcript_15264/g.27038  ORF Transcript_15264/g.27038 Transcript_15264/m.27038 type:complete len:127 (-) Transcript_15264:1477-1857(-)
MDIDMPVMDGITATKRIRKLEMKILRQALVSSLQSGASGSHSTSSISSAMSIQLESFDSLFRGKLNIQRLPIVGLTGKQTKGIRRQCMQCGMDHMIQKPIRKADLQDVIEKFAANYEHKLDTIMPF